MSRKTQRNDTFGRLNSVTADRGKNSGEQSAEPGDNLNSGDGSEEDGVDNRSEPEGWLPDGSMEATGAPAGATPSASVKTAPPPAIRPARRGGGVRAS